MNIIYYDFQVYEEEHISANVYQVTEASGVWSKDPVRTVTNYSHAGEQLISDGDLDYYDDVVDTAASRLTEWTGNAEATWHLDQVYAVGSVILRTLDVPSQLEMKLIDSTSSLTKTCTLVSTSAYNRQLNYDCNAPGD